MKLLISAMLGLLISQNSVAGDAGYNSRTCTSSSQRTVLTSLNDYTSNIVIYTLVIDGASAIYDSRDRSVSEVGDDGYLEISKNGKKAFVMDFNSQNGALALTVHTDPRTGTIAENNALPTPSTIKLTCKDYWPAP